MWSKEESLQEIRKTWLSHGPYLEYTLCETEKWERGWIFNFIPPSGDFSLMVGYISDTQHEFSLPVGSKGVRRSIRLCLEMAKAPRFQNKAEAPRFQNKADGNS